MEVLKKWKKSLIRRCKSSKEKTKTNTNSTNTNILPKSKSYPPWCSPTMSNNNNNDNNTTKSTSATPFTPRMRRHTTTPGGCFSVYVGPDRQRFVMKAEYASHPLFMMLLDDAKEQYGYHSEGPILLPCGVDLFYKVLAEMDCESISDDLIHPHHCCATYSSYGLFSPSRLLKLNHF